MAGVRGEGHECLNAHPWRGAWLMLTGGVNIAVFATFHTCVRRAGGPNAAFKPICRLHELDVSRYGRQRWHDRGKKRQGCGTVGGKNGKVSLGCGPLARPSTRGIQHMKAGVSGPFAGVCGCSGASGARWRHGDRTKIQQSQWNVKGMEAREARTAGGCNRAWMAGRRDVRRRGMGRDLRGLRILELSCGGNAYVRPLCGTGYATMAAKYARGVAERLWVRQEAGRRGHGANDGHEEEKA